MMSVAGEDDDDDDDEAQRAEPLRTARRAACRSMQEFEIKLKSQADNMIKSMMTVLNLLK